MKQAQYVGSYVKAEQLPADGLPEIALVGRSNVGKSSLINRIANRRNLAKSSSTPGKTRTINYYLINGEFYLVDLPGYGFAKVARSEKQRWGRMIESYLQRRPQLQGVIQLVDIRHAPSEQDVQMKDWLRQLQIPLLVVATKADKISRGARLQNLAVVMKQMGLEQIPLHFSAANGAGQEELLEEMAAALYPEEEPTTDY
ncbi:MAG: ribosome biogenesis GTP-binding protein YihA/YsxC [Syntrophomonas sp.]|nr:ribosome biogenesis GTP-binding protein YihA/YsxC [Syntrophomonas sp.]